MPARGETLGVVSRAIIRVLKGRRIWLRVRCGFKAPRCGVLSERKNFNDLSTQGFTLPKVAPWAGMRCPVGAF